MPRMRTIILATLLLTATFATIAPTAAAAPVCVSDVACVGTCYGELCVGTGPIKLIIETVEHALCPLLC